METRPCHRCHEEFPLSVDFFMRDKSRPHGLSYECKPCHRKRKKGRDRRKERWSKLSPERKLLVKARQKRYAATNKGRAVFLRQAYKRIDECDMTAAEVAALIELPCVYCGTTELPRGLDRKSNFLPHIKSNVRPSCAPCNFARGDRFTDSEMDRIGAVIREIMRDRLSTKVESEDHP